MNGRIFSMVLAVGMASASHAQVSGGSYAPLTEQQMREANEAAREAADKADMANPTPASPGWRAEQRGAYAEAAELYRKACYESQHAVSCHNLGYLYERGLGVPMKLPQAAAFYERALVYDPRNFFAKTRLADVRRALTPVPSPYRAGRKATDWEHYLACYYSRSLFANVLYQQLKKSGKNTDETRPYSKRARLYRYAAISILFDKYPNSDDQILFNIVNDSKIVSESDYLGYYDPYKVDLVCSDPPINMVEDGISIEEEFLESL